MRIDVATGFCSCKTLGSLNCAVGKTCDFMHPTGLELKKIQCKCGRAKSTPMFSKNGPQCIYNHKHMRTPLALEFTTAVAHFSGA